MRSRDGNNSFTLRFCAIILLFSFALYAEEYLVSYKYIVKNSILFNEHLDISKSMQKCHGIPSQILILPAIKEKNFQKLISLHRERFLDYIQRLGVDICSRATTCNNQMSATIVTTLKTTCFKVDFNDTFVKISHLK